MKDQFTETTLFNGSILPSRVLDFGDLSPIEIPVRLPWEGGAADFILREASHAIVKHYRSQALKGAEIIFDDDGNRTLKNLSGSTSMDTWLIAQCLSRACDDGKRQPVKEDFLSGLPERAVSEILETLQEMTPSLRVKEDLPNLKKQLAKLQDKIKRLEDQEERAHPKKLQSSGTESSASPTS